MSQFMQIAYEGLGLGMEGHEIGTMRYIDLPEQVLHTLCALHLDTVNEQLFAERPPATDKEADYAWCRDVRANCFLLFPRWLYLLKNIKSYEPTGWRDATLEYDDRCKAIVECHFKYDCHEGGSTNRPWTDGSSIYVRCARICLSFSKVKFRYASAKLTFSTFIVLVAVAPARARC
jgi:hypothetical protein